MPDELLQYLAKKIGIKKDTWQEAVFILTILISGWIAIAYYFIKEYK